MALSLPSVGVPAEIKPDERRVSLTCDGVRELEPLGIRVIIEAGAGTGAGIPDTDYRSAGAEIVDSAAEVWSRADLICKVKEPQPSEFGYLRPDLVLFTYLHLAAYPKVASALLDSGATGLAYETVMAVDGELPLLSPMSEVAGRLVVQVGARFLEAPQGGRGVLLGGASGVRPARVVVIGAGTVGYHAASIAVGMNADVLLLDKRIDRLRHVEQLHHGRITTLASNRGAVERSVADADLVVGAVLVAGSRAPTVVTEEMVASMQPRAVIVDVAIDQGGCVATARETTHEAPTYLAHEVLHYCVGNIPSAVPQTATYALTNSTLPYIVSLARDGVADACRRDPALMSGLNVENGEVVSDVIGQALDLPVSVPSYA